MKKTNLTKRIIAGLLAIAIVLGGVSVGNVTTVQAAIENFADLENTTVTMKVGDTKSINFVNTLEHGGVYDRTDNYNWSTSDENIVSLVNEYGRSVADTVKVDYFIITATGKSTGTTLSFTVVVKEPEVTATQQKCKHSWKVTKKATCLRSGMKVCSKCKLQKVVAKKKHVFVTKTEKKTTYTEYVVYQCNSCTSSDLKTKLYHNTENPFACHEVCGMEFSAKAYGSQTAAFEAYDKHRDECDHMHSIAMTFEYDNPKTTKVKVTRCKTCHNTPEAIEKYYK